MESMVYDLKNWKCFITVAEEGSIRQASKILKKNPSTISRSITALSNSLNLTLFKTEGKYLRLTPAGEEAYKKFAPLIAALDSNIQELNPEIREENQLLRIVASPGFSYSNVVKAVLRFQQEHPRTRFWLESMAYGSENFGLLGAGLDLIISSKQYKQANCVSTQVATHKNVCLRSTCLSATKLLHPLELNRFELVGNIHHIEKTVFKNNKDGQEISIPLNYAVVSDNTNLLLKLMEDKDAIMVGCPLPMATSLIEQGRFYIPLSGWSLPEVKMFAYYRTVSKSSTSLVESFLKVLKDTAHELEASDL